MKIQKLDAKKGYACVIPENLDDLWVLSEVLKPGDLIGMRSARKVKVTFGDRTESEKKSMFLKIATSGAKFHEYTTSLRVSGEIVEGPEDIQGSHTFSIVPSSKVEIWKEFGLLEIDLLKKSRSKRPEVVFVIIDRDEAFIASGGSRFWIKSGLPSKRSEEEENYSQFFGQIRGRLKEIKPQYVVIAGPGFTKDKLAEVLEYNSIIEGCSSVGESGLREVLSRGVLEKVGASVRDVEEHNAVEKIFECIHSGKSFYSLDDTKKAVGEGNVDFLVVSSSLIAKCVKSETYGELRKIIEKVKYGGGGVMLVGRNKDALSRLDGLGGIAGLRRWKL